MANNILPLSNAPHQPLRVPGFACIPLDFEVKNGSTFSDGSKVAYRQDAWCQDPRLTVRELAMIDLMDRITDQDNWHEIAFDQNAISRWKHDFQADMDTTWQDEQTGHPLISDAVWRWCLLELQSKAEKFKATGYTFAVDSGCRVVKADCIIPATIGERLTAAFNTPISEESWYTVKSLIDDSLHNLVFGRTKVLTQGGNVHLDNILDTDFQAELAPTYENRCCNPAEYAQIFYRNITMNWDRELVKHDNHAHLYTVRSQRLPCEFEFLSDGQGRITSYINNLHPVHQKERYNDIQTILNLALPPLSNVLLRNCMPPSPVRVQTTKLTWGPEPPRWRDELEPHHTFQNVSPQLRNEIEQFLAQPDRADWEFGNRMPPHRPVSRRMFDNRWRQGYSLAAVVDYKMWCLSHILHPEPGEAYSFQDWQAGKTGLSAPTEGHGDSQGADASGFANQQIDESGQTPLGQPNQNHEYYNVSLQETFKDQGLQVIVGAEEHHLEANQAQARPRNRESHTRGKMNEHIIATVFYIFDCDNVSSDARVVFRQHTKYPANIDRKSDGEDVGAILYGIPENPESLYSTLARYIDGLGPCIEGTRGSSVQNLGSAGIRAGRLLAFPNTLEYRLEGLQTADTSRPGRLAFLTIELVDPNYRICSTRNVPPQQLEWWAAKELDRLVPAEIRDQILKHLGELYEEDELEWIDGEWREDPEQWLARELFEHGGGKIMGGWKEPLPPTVEPLWLILPPVGTINPPGR